MLVGNTARQVAIVGGTHGNERAGVELARQWRAPAGADAVRAGLLNAHAKPNEPDKAGSHPSALRSRERPLGSNACTLAGRRRP